MAVGNVCFFVESLERGIIESLERRTLILLMFGASVSHVSLWVRLRFTKLYVIVCIVLLFDRRVLSLPPFFLNALVLFHFFFMKVWLFLIKQLSYSC